MIVLGKICIIIHFRLDFNGFYTQYSRQAATGDGFDLGGVRDLRQSVSLSNLSSMTGSQSLSRPPQAAPRFPYRGAGVGGSSYDVGTPSGRTSRTGKGRPPLLVMDQRNALRGSSLRGSREHSP